MHELVRFITFDAGGDAFTFTWKVILRHIYSVEKLSNECHDPLDS